LNHLNRLREWLNGFRYLPHARKRWSECGAIIIAGGAPWSLAQRGVETDEAGINIAAFSVRYYLAVNEKLPSNVGIPRARALADDFSRDITLRGETLVGGGGVLDFTIGTACVLNNDVNTFSQGTGPHGDILFDEATESQERAGWRTLDMRLSSDPELNLGP
jgi:hypothetical protein